MPLFDSQVHCDREGEKYASWKRERRRERRGERGKEGGREVGREEERQRR